MDRIAHALIGAWITFAWMTSAAYATSQRTFVASHGSDVGACSLSAPCRSFGAAIAQTTSGGEIIVLDSAGYGPVVITKPIAIIAPEGVYAGISVFTGTGIVVNHGSGNVNLRGLVVTGLGGTIGIDFQSGDSLQIERTDVSGFTSTGFNVALAGSGRVFVKDSSSRNNGVNGAHIGTGSGVVHAVIEHSQFAGNQFAGILFFDRALAQVTDTTIDANTYGLVVQPLTDAGGFGDVNVVGCTRCSVTANAIAGLVSGALACTNTQPVLNVVNSEVLGNNVGLFVQFCGVMDVSNVTFYGNTKARQIDGGGSMFTYNDNPGRINKAGGDAFTGSAGKQ